MVGLEEAIRKAGEGAEAMRTREMELCEASIDDLVRLESESRDELKKRKEGIKIVRSVVMPVEEPVHEDVPDEEEPAPEDGDGLVELARELDALNKAIEFIDREKKQVAKDTLRALEMDLGQIEGELMQLEREESHYFPHGRLSEDSDYQHYHQPTPPPSTGTGFKWRRTVDNRSFGGRFFRRSGETTQLPADFIPAAIPTSSSSNGMGTNGDDASTFAREHQRLWAQASASTANAVSTFGVRRRAGSLNSTGVVATARSRWGIKSTAVAPA